jgi:DNA modification methylase
MHSATSRLEITYTQTSALKPDPRNPRLHTDKQVRQIAQSIEAFGFNVPLLIDDEQKVIAGHGRLMAARRLGWDKVPAIRLSHLTEAQRMAFLIADNRLTENSSWDERMLGEQLKILSELELDFNLEAIGFETPEIDLFIDGLGIVSEADPDDHLPEISKSAVTVVGDVWQLAKHRVRCGNSLVPSNYDRLMEGVRADLVITDPPYNVVIDGHATGNGSVRHREFGMASGEMSSTEFTDFLSRAMIVARDHSADGSLAYYFMDWRHMTEILTAGMGVYSDLLNLCVWAKNNGGMGSFYRSAHELIFLFKHGKGSHRNNVQLGKYGRYRTNVWNYPGANSFGSADGEGNLLALHPTPKPVALIADAIKDCTARGDLVLDPFLGSGTAVIAAERTGRRCYGFELDPLYVDTIIRRWQKLTKLEAIHMGSGDTFNSRDGGKGGDRE